jgi:hypothetical protein
MMSEGRGGDGRMKMEDERSERDKTKEEKRGKRQRGWPVMGGLFFHGLF